MKIGWWKRLDGVLAAIAMLAAVLNTYNIWRETYANAYYTSAVTSMLQSFHNFFFASFDPGGFVTVDKPPVAFWVQTASAYVFGVHGWSVILPQALAGVGSVLLLYALVRPAFGVTAARLAALVLACTPIAAAVSRTNNVDSLLVFTLLTAAWMLFLGLRRGKALWMVAAFAMIGLAFNIKMLQAYMVLPAMYVLYVLAAKTGWKKKLGVLSAATAVLLLVSVSWAVVVDAIPANNRPYIGSSQTNSVLELAFGYNGIDRLTGNGGPGGGRGGGMPPQFAQDGGAPGSDGRMQVADGGAPGAGGGMPPGGFGPGGRDSGGMPGGARGGGMFNTGTPGPLRLLQSELSGQISWLLPLVAAAAIGLLAGVRRRQALTEQQQMTLFWLAWLLPGMAFFSVAEFFHPYYLIMLAPPIAALTGAGWTELRACRDRQLGWTRWLLPAGYLAATAFEVYVLYPYREQIGFMWPIAVGAAGAAASLLLIVPKASQLLLRAAALAGMLTLLAAPAYWAATPLLYGDNANLPEAGPQLHAWSGRPGGAGGPGGPGGESYDPKLMSYLMAHENGETYVMAVSNANAASSYIIETGKPVMAMGGFSGSDPIVTVEQLQQLVVDKQVKYFLIGSGGFGGGREGSPELIAWIREHGKEVPKEEWQSAGAEQGSGAGFGDGRSGAGQTGSRDIGADRTYSEQTGRREIGAGRTGAGQPNPRQNQDAPQAGPGGQTPNMPQGFPGVGPLGGGSMTLYEVSL